MLERLPALHVLCGLDVLAWRPLLRTSAVVGLVHGLWGRPMSSSSESRLAWTRVNSSSLKTSLCDVRFTERLEPWCKPSESAIAIEVSGVNTLSCDTLSPIEYGTTGPLSLWSSSGTDCSSPVDLDFLDGPTTSWDPCRLAFHRKILRTALSGWNFFRLPSAARQRTARVSTSAVGDRYRLRRLVGARALSLRLCATLRNTATNRRYAPA
uniref:Putative secreted protein n=1 Tax=Ixodes ricinus TaxID=34613 RepID=A0A6B0V1T7_IXORI